MYTRPFFPNVMPIVFRPFLKMGFKYPLSQLFCLNAFFFVVLGTKSIIKIGQRLKTLHKFQNCHLKLIVTKLYKMLLHS